MNHIQTIPYAVQIGDKVVEKVAIFNQNKLPTGVAVKCIETETSNRYLLTMTKDQYIALFMDDGDFMSEDTQKSDVDVPNEQTNVTEDMQD